MKPSMLASIAHEIGPADLPGAFATLIAGGAKGRYFIKVA